MSKHGEFKLKEAYEELRRKKTLVAWYDLAWYGKNIPMHLFSLWMGLSGALKTLEKLKL